VFGAIRTIHRGAASSAVIEYGHSNTMGSDCVHQVVLGHLTKQRSPGLRVAGNSTTHLNEEKSSLRSVTLDLLQSGSVEGL
jgi:hypothetical protein